jgi:hypothetical protein
MAKFRITSPEGHVYEINAPDTATEADAIAYVQQNKARIPRDFGIDFSQPIPSVRASIAKLPEADRQDARKQWADAYYGKERKSGGVQGVLQSADNVVRTAARGSFVGPLLDEANAATADPIAAVRAAISGESDPGSAPYYEALEYQRARDRAIDKDYPGASLAGRLAGGLAGGVGALKSAGQGLARGAGAVAVGGPLGMMKPAATLRGQMAQGAIAGPAYAAAGGYGEGTGGAGNRLDNAADSIPMGLAVSLGLPPAIAGVTGAAQAASNALSPVFARTGQQMRNAAQSAGIVRPPRQPASLSAAANAVDPSLPPITGADAAADQILANQLSRAGVSEADLRVRLRKIQENMRLDSNSNATDAVVLADLDPSLQRLAGSVARQQPEAGNLAANFIAGRQTGITPLGGMPAQSGIETRASMSGYRQTQNVAPVGQFERVADALKRAMKLQDYQHHGHGKNAYRTEQSIIAQAKQEADELYGKAYKSAERVDIRETVLPVMERWQARMAEEPRAVAGMIRRGLRQFQSENGLVANLQRFDKAKQYLDNQIDKLFLSGDRYMGGVLNEMKTDLLAAVDAIPRVGKRYQEARGAFGSHMEMRDALNLGRKVFKEDSDIAADQFLQLNEGQQKMFRLGLLESFVKHMGREKRGADVTAVFESPRIQSILEVVIPRTQTKSGRVKMVRGEEAIFANRPERFAGVLEAEKAGIRTRNEVLGNSKTAERLADDAAFNEMSDVIEQLSRNPSVMVIGMRVIQRVLDKFFGMRADTAAKIAQRLFTATPAERDRILLAIGERLGPSRADQLAVMMRTVQRQMVQAGAVSGTQGEVSQ